MIWKIEKCKMMLARLEGGIPDCWDPPDDRPMLVLERSSVLHSIYQFQRSVSSHLKRTLQLADQSRSFCVHISKSGEVQVGWSCLMPIFFRFEFHKQREYHVADSADIRDNPPRRARSVKNFISFDFFHASFLTVQVPNNWRQNREFLAQISVSPPAPAEFHSQANSLPARFRVTNHSKVFVP